MPRTIIQSFNSMGGGGGSRSIKKSNHGCRLESKNRIIEVIQKTRQGPRQQSNALKSKEEMTLALMESREN